MFDTFSISRLMPHAPFIHGVVGLWHVSVDVVEQAFQLVGYVRRGFLASSLHPPCPMTPEFFDMSTPMSAML